MMLALASSPPDPGRSSLQRLRDWVNLQPFADPELKDGLSKNVEQLAQGEADAKATLDATMAELAALRAKHAAETVELKNAHAAEISDFNKTLQRANGAVADRERQTAAFLQKIISVLAPP